MKNWIDKYIKDKRTQLDIEEPDDQFIWDGISNELEKSNRNRIPWLKIAALFIIFLTAGYFIMYRFIKQDEEQKMITIADLSEELGKQENLYQLTINQQMENIQSMDVDPEVYKSFFDEIEVLDQYYDEYLKDLQEVGNKQKLIQAMLHYYELKIRILSRMLNEIEKTKHNENKSKRL